MRRSVPWDGPVHSRLTALRNGLLSLHKALLDSERRVYDRDVRRIETTGQLLALVLNDPWFDWLRELSRMVVTIDEALAAEEPVTSAGAERLIGDARSLLAPSETANGFRGQYFLALQRDPDVVLAHGRMMKLLAELE